MGTGLRRVSSAVCTLLLVAGTLTSAQQKPQQKQPPGSAPSTAESDIDTLKRQIQALIAGQIAMQKQLDEIKTLLSRAPAAAPAPAPAPSPVTVVDTLIDTAGAATKGAAAAKVALVEFSDYECPFCGRYSRDTLPQLTREYIDSGKVRYIFKNLPLESIHPNAFKAAVAAECAGEQGKYWQLHDQLFANQQALDAASLANHGRTAGLDVARFQQCLSSDKHAARIRKDQSDAQQAGAGSTPTIFIATVTPGDTKVRAVRIIRGAQPYQTFKGAIDSVLASAK